jgi:phage terminase small subunit
VALTDKQKAFINEYFLCGYNATEAARRAGYKGNDVTLASIGWENLRKPQIDALISERMREHTMSANEVLARLSQQARLSVEDFYDFPGGAPIFKPDRAKERGVLHLVKGFKITDKEFEIKFHDAQAALIQLGKYHALFTDKQEVSGSLDIKLTWPDDNDNPGTPETPQEPE